ncbi:unnamed protein product [Clavelina lepadiformis]|uniref:Uncharacterized protein n=1 Tax=Clavelina lepadiformis TaxID=159417 RepID=A0ABP0GM62_CLALP
MSYPGATCDPFYHLGYVQDFLVTTVCNLVRAGYLTNTFSNFGIFWHRCDKKHKKATTHQDYTASQFSAIFIEVFFKE